MSPKKSPVTEISKGKAAAADVTALLRARNPLLWISTREEDRVEKFLIEAAIAANYKPLFWDVASGITSATGREPTIGTTDQLMKFDAEGSEGSKLRDCGAALAAVKFFADKRLKDNERDVSKKPERIVWIFRDLPRWLGDDMSGASPTRQLRNLAKYTPNVPRYAAQAIIILTTAIKVPSDLAGHTTVVDWPLPDRLEMETILDSAVKVLPEYMTNEETGQPDKSRPVRSLATTPETRELAIDAAMGLTEEEAAACFAKSIVLSRTIDHTLVMNEKKRVISREKVLEWQSPIKGGMKAVGGLDTLKAWVTKRKNARTQKARDYGLRAPKGIALVGMSGCGKSLAAKCVPTDWGVPLLRLDMGALKGKYVGESEGNIRKALKVIEAIGPSVVWIDEIDKAMAGASGNGAADGGVSTDALGVVLNWMQERTCEAFVIATANNIENLPPELFRKGRFDEVFYVGFPNAEERESILRVTLAQYDREGLDIDLRPVVAKTDRFTGAEIAELIPTAMYEAYDDNCREITTEDLLVAAADVNPIANSKRETVEKIEKWGMENARSATSKKRPAEIRAEAHGREVDL